MSYADIVNDYRDQFRERARRDLRFYAIQPSIARAVELAGLARAANGKRQSHQRRLSSSTLVRARSALDQCDFRECQSFEELFTMVDAAIGGIHGIGALMVYDTAHRTGAYLSLEPQCVYLHAGTRAGARALGLGRGAKTLEISELPAEFRTLTAAEIEDCLCIYKGDLQRINSK